MRRTALQIFNLQFARCATHPHPFRAATSAITAAFAFLATSPSFAAFPYPPAAPPHPAVARIIVAERGATSYGTGTLVDVRDQYGLVITNWHVVRDATAPPEVVFPNGFRSQARPLKLDSNWDLAALVIWRPPIEPVKISHDPPQPGERLTICGYGPGDYRAVTGRCTQYFAPRPDYPHEFVELNVEARQGDSGGPIFNDRGELAGVLFGAGRGTTMGGYGGRVHSFLASLAPDIGQPAQPHLFAEQTQPVQQPQPQAAHQWQQPLDPQPYPQQREQIASLLPPQDVASATGVSTPPIQPQSAPSTAANAPAAAIARLAPIEPAEPAAHILHRQHEEPTRPREEWIAYTDATEEGWTSSLTPSTPSSTPLASLPSSLATAEPLSWRDVAGGTVLQQLATLLAIMAAVFVILQLAKFAGR